MNFYQSKLRKIINKDIYNKPTFEQDFSGQQLFWITKSQKRLWKTLNRFMIHGVEENLQTYISKHQKEIQLLKRDFEKSRWDIFFQLWCIDVLWSWDTALIKSDKDLIEKISKQKTDLNELYREKYQLVPSWREHMPDATVVIDLSTGIEHVKSWYSRSCKRYINKSKKQNLTFARATKKQWSEFWTNWYEMSYDKWFTVLEQELFLELMMYITESEQWDLFVAMKWDEIVSGSVMLWIGHDMYYFYGATNRAYGDIWWHYRLKNEIFTWACGKWYDSCDLLWVAPPYNMEHHYLWWVTRFKQSFGGKTILYTWNYDLVFNSMLYRLMQTLKK